MADDTYPSWTRWLREAREAMKEYGYRRIPLDYYREQFAVGKTPEQAAKYRMVTDSANADLMPKAQP